MIEFKSNQRLFITGRTGTGKTHLVKKVFLPSLKRVLIHDRKHTLKGVRGTICRTPKDIVVAWNRKKDKIVYRPDDPSTDDFDRVCKLIFRRGNYVFVGDEIQSYASASFLPFYFGELLRLGRERNTGVIAISQRPTHVYNTVISEADIIIAFHLRLKADRKKMAETIGDEAMDLNVIQRHSFLLYDDFNGAKVHKPI